MASSGLLGLTVVDTDKSILFKMLNANKVTPNRADIGQARKF